MIVEEGGAVGEDEELRAEGVGEVGLAENIGGGAEGDEAMVEEQDEVELAGGEVEVVGGDHDGDLGCAEVIEEVEGGIEGGDIHAGEGFVHEEDVRLLGEGAGEEDALLLPTGEVADGTAAQVGDAHLAQALVNDLTVMRGGGLEPTLDIVTTHHDDVANGDREAPVDFFALGDVGHAVLVVAEGEAVDEDASGGEGQEADKGFEEVDLPAPLGPTTATREPWGMLKVRSRRTSLSP